MTVHCVKAQDTTQEKSALLFTTTTKKLILIRRVNYVVTAIIIIINHVQDVWAKDIPIIRELNVSSIRSLGWDICPIQHRLLVISLHVM